MLYGRQKRSVRIFERGGVLSQGPRRSDHHSVRHPARARGHKTQTHCRKDVDVVTLGDGDVATAISDGCEGRPGSHQGATVGPANQVFRLRLRPLRGIGEREDDGALDLAGHLADDGLGECSARGGEADQNRRVDFPDHICQANFSIQRSRPAGHALRSLRVGPLLRRKIGSPCVEQASSVHDPEAAARLFGREPVRHHRLAQVIRNAHTR